MVSYIFNPAFGSSNKIMYFVKVALFFSVFLLAFTNDMQAEFLQVELSQEWGSILLNFCPPGTCGTHRKPTRKNKINDHLTNSFVFISQGRQKSCLLLKGRISALNWYEEASKSSLSHHNTSKTVIYACRTYFCHVAIKSMSRHHWSSAASEWSELTLHTWVDRIVLSDFLHTRNLLPQTSGWHQIQVIN